MSFFHDIWTTFLYTPLINALIYLYNTLAEQNLGWAVVWLTIGLRTVLLPFSIIGERNRSRYVKLSREIASIDKNFKNDPVQRRGMIRGLLKKHKISPWAKTIVFVFQALLFLVLYRVFLGGVRGKISVDMLYDGVDYPVVLNTNFYGFDVAHRSLLWGGIVMVVLFLDIYLQQRNAKITTKNDQWFSILFPLFIGGILMVLPMIKSLFVLTSLAYSAIIRLFGGHDEGDHGNADHASAHGAHEAPKHH